MKLIRLLIGFYLAIGITIAYEAQAAKGAGVAGASMNAETLGAKALLEDLMVRRYGQELSTLVDKPYFSLGAQLDLIQLPKKVLVPKPVEEPTVQPEPLSDLMLGTIDPEQLVKKYAPIEQRETVQGFLDNYRIRAVTMSVGIKEELGPAVKAEVEKWLNNRLKAEFGAAGKGTVSVIKVAPEKVVPEKPEKKVPEKVKTIWDWLDQFQSLAGQIVLALAFILGTILWRLLSKTSSNKIEASGGLEASGGVSNPNAGGSTAGSPSVSPEELKKAALAEQEQLQATEEIILITGQLNALVPKIANEFENIMRAWCQTGDAGKMKLACFAEVVGRDIGKLPIPVDALGDVSKAFTKMIDINAQEKRDFLKSAYWDLISVLNLGAATLSQPFGYLGGANVGTVNQILMDQNPKMKTLVSLYLPSELRSKYIRSLSIEGKQELLASALELSEIGASDLKSLDGALMQKMKPSDNKDTIPLDMTLNKLVESLSRIEELTLLPGLNGGSMPAFKRSIPSLAFIGEWPDNKVEILLSRSTSDEVTTLARVRPELTERLVNLAPPLTSEVVRDNLSSTDNSSEKEKNALLQAMTETLKTMVNAQEIVLEEIFSANPAQVTPLNGGKLSGNDNQKAS